MTTRGRACEASVTAAVTSFYAGAFIVAVWIAALEFRGVLRRLPDLKRTPN